MRSANLSLIALVISCCGCSILIAGSGKDLSKLNTREEVHIELGEPISGVAPENELYEEYRTHRKIADQVRAMGYGVADGMTFGLAEFVAFPHALFISARRSLLGQTVRFTYDRTGQVVRIDLDGGPLLLPRSISEPDKREGFKGVSRASHPSSDER